MSTICGQWVGKDDTMLDLTIQNENCGNISIKDKFINIFNCKLSIKSQFVSYQL